MNIKKAAAILYAHRGWQVCQHCGRVGPDVRLRPAHQGGESTMQLQCEDVTACWARWDAQHADASSMMEDGVG